MNFLDWALIVVFALVTYLGYRAGLVNSVLNFVAVYVALILSGIFAGRILGLFWDGETSEALSMAVGYVVIFVAAFLIARILSKIVKGGLNLVFLGWTDKLGGVVAGALVGLVLVGAMTAVLARYTYVIPEEPPPADSPSFIDTVVREAENYLNTGIRNRVDGQLVDSSVIPPVLEIRGLFAPITPREFAVALDVLEVRIEEDSS